MWICGWDMGYGTAVTRNWFPFPAGAFVFWICWFWGECIMSINQGGHKSEFQSTYGTFRRTFEKIGPFSWWFAPALLPVGKIQHPLEDLLGSQAHHGRLTISSSTKDFVLTDSYVVVNPRFQIGGSFMISRPYKNNHHVLDYSPDYCCMIIAALCSCSGLILAEYLVRSSVIELGHEICCHPLQSQFEMTYYDCEGNRLCRWHFSQMFLLAPYLST